MVASQEISARIKALGRTQKEIAKEMGLSQGTLSLKINNERPFFLDEACQLAEILDIREEFFAYFFSPEVALRN